MLEVVDGIHVCVCCWRRLVQIGTLLGMQATAVKLKVAQLAEWARGARSPVAGVQVTREHLRPVLADAYALCREVDAEIREYNAAASAAERIRSLAMHRRLQSVMRSSVDGEPIKPISARAATDLSSVQLRPSQSVDTVPYWRRALHLDTSALPPWPSLLSRAEH